MQRTTRGTPPPFAQTRGRKIGLRTEPVTPRLPRGRTPTVPILRDMDDGIREPAAPAQQARSSELLGFGPDARVLIINADDFGMYNAVNSAVIRSVEEGIASSCSLMPPCPAAAHAM